ncbi:hypothetical protein F4823DRAFT_609280 [Ustulina deusta]|nr:hypothetical protein F4823DRAFT_609280 [Ustulina deusta]
MGGFVGEIRYNANGFILDREARMPLRWRTERSNLLSFTVQAYLRLIEDRLAALELDSPEKQKRNSSSERAGQRADSQHTSRSSSSSRKEEIHQETRNTNATKPDLNPVPWQDFKRKHDVERNPSQEHTIDILTDDPIIPHDVWRDRYYRQHPMHLRDQRRYRYFFFNINLQTNSPEKVHKDPTPAAKTAKTSPDFYFPIPDRIRINGEALIQLLDKTFELSTETVDKPLVILKPYKVLVHHANGIRRLHQKLANKYEGIVIAAVEEENAVAEISNTIPTHGQSNSEDDGGDDFFATEGGRNLLRNYGTEQAYKELGCLVKFMDEYLSPLSRFVNASVQRIYFSDLWHIFQPGEVVITSMKPLNAYRLLHATGGRSYLSPPEEEQNGTDYTKPYRVPDKASDFAVTCYQIDFDGTRFGPVTKEFKIQKFDDQQDVTSLQIYPLRFAKDPAAIRETLSKNGQVFLDLSKAGHVQYRGPNLHEAETIDSQIIVDFHAALSDRQDKDDSWKYEVNFGIQRPVSANEAEVVMVSGGGCKEPNCCENDIVFDDRRMEDFIQGNGMLTTDVRYLSDDPKQIDKQDLILFPHRLFAFVLKDRKWAVVDVNHILVIDEKTRQRDRAWNSLVLPEGHKPMVYSLVQAHFRSRGQGGPEEAQQDLIRRKGKGLIILLHGAPGVGKTSTAECVAELCDRPLYPITCGDLGITAVQVESQLKRIFVQAQKWKCVLLLDEADVFLSQRENNVKHNSLVSVFLRVLEYYQGILFLTTNRVGKMDEAFRSRVHISLYYPPLSKDSMLDIFTENIKLIESRTINRARVKKREILEFASNHYEYNEPHTRWNGRQIRNAFHIAVALAENDALELETKGRKSRKTSTPVMRATHFDVVERASTQFDDYLHSVLGMAQSDIARQESVRKDNWQSNQDHKGKRSDRNRASRAQIIPRLARVTGSGAARMTILAISPSLTPGGHEIGAGRTPMGQKTRQPRGRSARAEGIRTADIRTEVLGLGTRSWKLGGNHRRGELLERRGRIPRLILGEAEPRRRPVN